MNIHAAAKNNPIILASDHAGFALKEAVKTFLHEKGYAIDDMGAHTLDPEDDYPPYMAKAAMKVKPSWPIGFRVCARLLGMEARTTY
jgi:ribose 5-phosphate isomerase B